MESSWLSALFVSVVQSRIGVGHHMSVEKRYAAKVVRRLTKAYPDAECALHHDSPFQLLVATILSAQCTDKRVNIVTDVLFRKYPSVHHLAAIPLKTLEKEIKTTGFFRSKAKNIKACSQQLLAEHDGEVPQTIDEMVQLAGVGRKTANVVLGTAFGIASGVVVDTHVSRISQRLGLTAQKDPVKIEKDLVRHLPKKEWILYSHRVIHHGRKICKARKPDCEECSLNDICPRIGVAGD